ncbi:hypothetical protein [Dyadobacter crusticola]|uniref:hypothetical protein n=1 Tax=Dyadobacter crusticola TaxID=292407 RepID=UPI0006891F47|nr:hypothetical protein [Dyadobacter crusticola]
MVTLKFVKGDWVKEKNGSTVMRIDEYQVVESLQHANGNNSNPVNRPVYNGRVWCTWVNENKTVVTQPFWQDDLELASPND